MPMGVEQGVAAGCCARQQQQQQQQNAMLRGSAMSCASVWVGGSGSSRGPCALGQQQDTVLCSSTLVCRGFPTLGNAFCAPQGYRSPIYYCRGNKPEILRNSAR